MASFPGYRFPRTVGSIGHGNFVIEPVSFGDVCQGETQIGFEAPWRTGGPRIQPAVSEGLIHMYAWSYWLGAALAWALQQLMDFVSFGVVVHAFGRVFVAGGAQPWVGGKPIAGESSGRWVERIFGDEPSTRRAFSEVGGRSPMLGAILSVEGSRSARIAVSRRRWGPIETWFVLDVSAAMEHTQLLELAFEHSLIPQFLCDENEIFMCNQATADAAGTPREQLVGIHPRSLSPEFQADGRSSAEAAPEIEAEISKHGSLRFEWLHKRADGSTFPCEVSVKMAALPSGKMALVSSWVDLTERDAKLAAQADAQAAKAALRDRQRFLATMSHELRTPMNGVLGLTTTLLDDLELRGDHRDVLQAIDQSGKDLRRLLDEILDYSKLESGQLQLEARTFDLEGLVEQVANLHRGVARGQGGDITVDTEGQRYFVGDELRVRQILSNLVSNAVKFSAREDGRAKVVRVVARARHGEVRLAVEDQGVGIGPDQLALVFEPFKQADASSTRRFGGTGLGLATVKGLVDAMGGAIRVESTLSIGSRFEVVLPLTEAAEAKRGPSEALPPRLPCCSILVAEDVAINRMVLERMLRSYPEVNLRFVEDGSEVGPAVEAEAPDLVLMDIHMPHMDGLEATRRLRAAGYSGPVVALTASALDDELRGCIESGMNGVLTKPVQRSQLLDTIGSCVDAAAAGLAADR